MTIENDILDQLLCDYNYKKPEEPIGENGLLKELTKALLERALQGELTHHITPRSYLRKTNRPHFKNFRELLSG